MRTCKKDCAAAAQSPESCTILCDSMDCSLPGSSVHGILQARVLEWVAMPSSRGPFRPRGKLGSPAQKADCLPCELPGKPIQILLSRFSCVRLCATPETAAHQAPPSLGFSRQDHWSGLPFPSPIQILLIHKKNEKLSFPTTWVDLKGIMLREISQNDTL